MGRRRPSKLNDVELRAYLSEHFEFSKGQTALDLRVIEQTYAAIFWLLLNSSTNGEEVDLHAPG